MQPQKRKNRKKRFKRRLAQRQEQELIMVAGKIALQGMREEEREKLRG